MAKSKIHGRTFMRFVMSIFALAALFFVSVSDTSQARGWEKLGTRQVDLRKDRDVITVGRDKGRFRNLQIRVRGNQIFFKRMRIIFGNGSSQTLVLNQRVREGAISSPIDLKGDARYIKRIVLVYKRIANFRGKAFVTVLGRSHGAFVSPRKWRFIGKQKVNLFRDRDVIQVGRSKGKFRRLQLRVTGNDIFFKTMTVVFGNGRSQTFTVNRTIREGTITPGIDLKGNARYIRHIKFNYRKRVRTLFRGKAFVSVFGK